MPGRGKGVKRKRAPSSTPLNPESTLGKEDDAVEKLDLLGAEAATSQSGKDKGTFVDFETLISESLALPTIHQQQSQQSNLSINSDCPELIRCGGDKLGAHIPEHIKLKIKQHEFVNLSVLLKGAVELTELQTTSLLGVDEEGHVVTKHKSVTEKVQSIEKWTDAFLIYSSIYLSAHPELTQDLLHYMYVIREAAFKYGGVFWRTYDEQFRLRQGSQFMPWSSINSDLWLRCFPAINRPLTGTNIPQASLPPCIDFNKGYCKWLKCRFPHVCAVCNSRLHGRWSCGVNQSSGYFGPPQSFRSGFSGPPQHSRGSFRGSNSATFSFRGRGRGNTRGKTF